MEVNTEIWWNLGGKFMAKRQNKNFAFTEKGWQKYGNNTARLRKKYEICTAMLKRPPQTEVITTLILL